MNDFVADTKCAKIGLVSTLHYNNYCFFLLLLQVRKKLEELMKLWLYGYQRVPVYIVVIMIFHCHIYSHLYIILKPIHLEENKKSKWIEPDHLCIMDFLKMPINQILTHFNCSTMSLIIFSIVWNRFLYVQIVTMP